MRPRRPVKYSNKPKYCNTPTRIDNHTFDSKAEAAYYQLLKLDPEVLHIDVHPYATLGPGDRHCIDFLVWYADRTCEFVDVKGPRKTSSAAVFRRLLKRWNHPVPLHAVCIDRRGRVGEWT